MTMDKSLRSKAALKRQRSVLTRAERLLKLREEGLWKEGDSIFGLRKVRVEVVKRRVKAKKEEKAPVAAAAAPAEAAKAPESKGARPEGRAARPEKKSGEAKR